MVYQSIEYCCAVAASGDSRARAGRRFSIRLVALSFSLRKYPDSGHEPFKGFNRSDFKFAGDKSKLIVSAMPGIDYFDWII